MATVVSHAMRRYPGTPSDADYSTYGYGGASSSQPWTKVEESESSLSRSMRYAEPWLYGSVRAPSGLYFTPALVLCSCADYLNGTKRSRKGQTTCKKCKGTRIPLNNVETSKFGTVRYYPTAPAQQTSVRAGTVRESTKSRPSILNPAGDPYDLVRRSRLSVSDNVSQYRTRSVSPNKNRNGETRSSSTTRNKPPHTNPNSVKYSTVGRKSILECNVNPYELMSTDGEQQDASITFVNGQRIRVRPRIQDTEYEDVQLRRHSSQRHKSGHQLVKLKNAQLASPKPNRNEKESECNRFKSILKKPTTTFNDTDLKSGPERSPSPAHKSGSHFYLPLPANSTPRKKVQFLVENELVSHESKELNNYEVNDVFREHKIKKQDEEEEETEKMAIKSSDNLKIDDDTLKEKDSLSAINSCKLRRSKSERKSQEAARVLFHDTMALRVRSGRNDTRDMFFKTDLEKLDGIDFAKLRNFDKIRPRGPPPQPPQTLERSSSDVNIQNLKLPVATKLAPLASPECLVLSQEVNVIDRKKVHIKERRSKSNVQPFLNSTEGTEVNENKYSVDKKEIDKDKTHCSLDRAEKIRQGSENMSKTTPEVIEVPFDNETSSKIEKTLNSLDKPSVSQNNDKEIISNKNNEEAQNVTNNSLSAIETEKHVKEIPKTTSENVIEIVPLDQFESADGLKVEKSEIGLQNIVSVQSELKNEMDIDTMNYTSANSLPSKCLNIEAPSAPPRKKSNNRQSLTINTANKNSINIVSPVVLNETANKTIVKISSPVSTVHKLKIRNEFPEASTTSVSISENNLGKTSIMINGDDCYCTVNIKDDGSIYQSSVVVKDTGIVVQTPDRKSSSIYITGNFISAPLDNNINETIEENKISDVTENISNCEKEEYSKTSSNNYKFNTNKEGDLQNSTNSGNDNVKKEKNKVTNDNTPDNRSLEICSSEMLKQLLCDPVEAVKRNLVPHVCGKSDVSRRPRGKKYSESDDLVASFLNDSLLRNTPPDYLQANHVSQLIEESFLKLRNHDNCIDDDKDVSSEHSSSTQYEIMDPGSDCYTDNSNRSSVTEEELSTRSKFYELLAESAVEVADNDDHHYESIKTNVDPIYEEIEIPPPLPMNPPPSMLLDDLQLDKEYTTRSIFEGASKYDILSYLVDAKERGIVPEDSYTFNFHNSGIVAEDDVKETSDAYNRVSHMSSVSDSSEESSLVLSSALIEDKVQKSIEVERNDSGVGSETSKSSLSKYRVKQEQTLSCEDCDSTVDIPGENEPLICRKCLKRRSERKEIITEIVETEEKYSRDLQIILEEFYQPMLVAGLLTSEQLSAIFLNVEELLENSQALAERLRDAVEIAIEQGDEDLLTVNIGKLILEAAPMLHAFETYCIRQGAASLLLASLEKEKELLRIFLRVSQMENTVLRRMNLNSFLMVPVQRVTKYPLLLARLYKVTPIHHETREQLKEAQHKIELHLNHMNSETKDVPSKLWRRISSNNGRRSSSEMDLVNIKLRKIAVDVLEWNHDEARFALEGKLLFTQPTDNNWRKGRTIKLSPVNALLVTNGKVSNSTTRPDPVDEGLIFSRHSGVREAALLLVRDKNGRYSLLREPLYLDRCVIAADPAWQSYFEVQELLGKDTFIFKADDEDQTKIWYRHLQYYAQGMGAWRKRRNALANIMINGMGLRS